MYCLAAHHRAMVKLIVIKKLNELRYDDREEEMDFHELLQKAASNQVCREKKHERERSAKEQEKVARQSRQMEQRHKAAAKLQQEKQKNYNEKMKYKGLIHNYSPSPKATPTPPPDQTSHSKSLCSHPMKHSSSTKSSSKSLSNSSSISQTNNPAASGSGHALKHKHKFPGGTGLAGGSQASASTSSSRKEETLISRRGGGKESGKAAGNGAKAAGSIGSIRKAGSKPAVKSSTMGTTSKQKTHQPSTNFSDLMRLAQKNSLGPKSSLLTVAESKERSISPSRTTQSPVGKSLIAGRMNKQSGHGKTEVNGRGRTAVSGRGRTDMSGRDPGENGVKKVVVKARKPAVSAVAGVSRDLSLARQPLRSTSSSPLKPPSPLGKSLLSQYIQKGNGKVARQGVTSQQGVAPQQGATPQWGGAPRQSRAPRRGGAPRQGGVSRTAGATAFYGAAAANILRQGSKSRGPSGVYRSTWVDEMSEYMRNGVAPDDDEEEDSDLDGFVASDDEFLEDEVGAGQSHDYSAEIRKLFRYDPRKFVSDDGCDDGVMESSYAQQEFEEMRSSRIGHAEDAEDMARERAHRKRKKQTLDKSALKQTKLSF